MPKFVIDYDRLSEDEKRSFSMLARNKSWGKAVKPLARVSEAVTPVEQPKLTVVYERESRPARRVTTTRKAKTNTFFEDVIVPRAQKRTIECKKRTCYKFGHFFSELGWYGDKTHKGHSQLSAH